MTMGRNSLLPEVKDELLSVLSSGATVKDACDFVGIGLSTYHRWCELGLALVEGRDHPDLSSDERLNQKYLDFLEDATRARAQGRVRAIHVIQKSIAEKQDVQAAQWFLERTDPQNWGRQTKHTIDLNVNTKLLNKVVNRLNEMGLDPDTVFERMLEQLEADLLPESVADGD